jgi:hypothetical protein
MRTLRAVIDPEGEVHGDAGRALRFHVYAPLEDAIETAERLAADG